MDTGIVGDLIPTLFLSRSEIRPFHHLGKEFPLQGMNPRILGEDSGLSGIRRILFDLPVHLTLFRLDTRDIAQLSPFRICHGVTSFGFSAR